MNKTAPTAQDIINIVVKVSGYSFEQLTAKTRKEEIVNVRHLLRYMLKKHTPLSNRSIGEMVYKSHHTTIISSVDVAIQLIAKSDVYRNLVDDVEAEIGEKFMRIDHLLLEPKISDAGYILKGRKKILRKEEPKQVKIERPKAIYSNRQYSY